MSLRIRPATMSDGAAVEDLWCSLLAEESDVDARFRPASDARARWRADYPEWLRDTTRAILVAEVDGQLVGFVSARLWGPPAVLEPEKEIFVEYLYVDDVNRGEGTGKALVGEARRWGASLGAVRLRARALARSESAVRFWKSCGCEVFSVEMEAPVDPDPLASREKGPLGFRGNPG